MRAAVGAGGFDQIGAPGQQSSFLRAAYQEVNGIDPIQWQRLTGQRILFGFNGDGDSDGDIVVTELLRREGKRLGLAVTDDGVFDFIRGLAAFSGKTLTQEQFSAIRHRLGVSEEELLASLKAELLARETASFLYQQTTVPPESFWEYYKKFKPKEWADTHSCSSTPTRSAICTPASRCRASTT